MDVCLCFALGCSVPPDASCDAGGWGGGNTLGSREGKRRECKSTSVVFCQKKTNKKNPRVNNSRLAISDCSSSYDAQIRRETNASQKRLNKKSALAKPWTLISFFFSFIV